MCWASVAASLSKRTTWPKSTFQEHTVLHPDSPSHAPRNMSYKSAAVVLLGLANSAAALFSKDQLNLQLPSELRQRSTGKIAIIWGRSTSAGCNAIQLAVAAGYEVFGMASSKNFNYLKKLAGAAQVFDYKQCWMTMYRDRGFPRSRSAKDRSKRD